MYSFFQADTALTGLALLFFTILALQTAALKKVWPSLPLSIWMLIYLAWLSIVTTTSTIPNTSILTAWTLAGLPFTYLAWSILPNTDMLWSRLRILLWIGGMGMALWGLWQVVQPIGNSQGLEPLIDRNAYAALMNLLWFPAAYLFLTAKTSAKHWMPFFSGAGLFIISAALFATESRGSIVIWALLLPMLLWAGYRYAPSRRLVWLIPFTALAAYLVSAQVLGTSVADRTYDLAQNPSTGARLLMWKSTIQMTLAHPLTGTGWGTFADYYPAYRSLLENTTSGQFAHNDYLQLAAEGGIPALLLQLGLMLGLLFQLKRSLKRASDPAGLESVALLLSALALFIHAGVNFIFYFAFMNILAGLYLARAAQLVEPARNIPLPSFEQISRPIKYLLAGFIALLLAAPLLIHLTAQLCLTGSQPGLKALNLVAPNLTGYDIAKLISVIRPQEGIAQEVMLQASEQALKDSDGISMKGDNFQRRLLNEALENFDLMRAQTANNPNIGVREVQVLLDNHSSLDGDAAYTKAHQVLSDNLKADPYHAYSMIYLARLQAAEGHRTDALYTLQRAEHHVLTRRDQQLVTVEILRQLAAPKIIPELDDIEQQLHKVRSESETGKVLKLPAHFSEDIDVKLNAIAAQLQPAH